MNRKHFQLLIGLLVSAIFIWIAFRAGGVTLGEIVAAFGKINWLFAFPMMAITMASFYWRGYRWRIFLADAKDVPPRRLYGPLMIGFAFNNILPARAGEVARPLALYKQEKVPLGAGFSTILIERLVDVFTLLALLIAMPLYVSLDPNISRAFEVGDSTYIINEEWIRGKLPLLSLAALILLAGFISFLIDPIRRVYLIILRKLPLLPGWLKEKLEGFIQSFATGCQCLKRPKALVWIIIHSVIIWFSVAFSFQVMSWGFPGVELTFGGALFFLLVTCLIISIPSSPGFWGLYEFGGMVALLMMGVVANSESGASDAFTFTLVVHALQWLPITAYGLWAAGRLSVTAHDVDEISEENELDEESKNGREEKEAAVQGETTGKQAGRSEEE